MIPSKAVVLAHDASVGPGVHRAVGNLAHGCLSPTPLLSVANRPLLRHALEWIAASEIRSVVVVTPEAMAQSARKAVGRACESVAVDWLEQLPGEDFDETLMAVDGFLAGEPFVLHLADSLASQDLRSLTGGALPNDYDALILVDERAGPAPDDVIDLPRRLQRKQARFRVRGGAPAGVAVLGGGALEAAGSLDPLRGRSLEAMADALLELGGSVRTCSVSEWWRFRGDARAHLEGNRFALERLRPDFEDAQLVRSDIQGAVVADPTARIQSSTVRGPAIIGPGALVRDAYVGPYTSIGKDVLVDGAEIEHSVVLSGASISHLGARLEASVVGHDAKIFRDFRLPRALRLQVGEGANVSLA